MPCLPVTLADQSPTFLRSHAGEAAEAVQQRGGAPSSASGGAPTVVTEVAMQARLAC